MRARQRLRRRLHRLQRQLHVVPVPLLLQQRRQMQRAVERRLLLHRQRLGRGEVRSGLLLQQRQVLPARDALVRRGRTWICRRLLRNLPLRGRLRQRHDLLLSAGWWRHRPDAAAWTLGRHARQQAVVAEEEARR
jgi:hypothetical protein